MKNLDLLTSQYRPQAATAIENDLILNWYPKRIIKRIKRFGSLLELGLGHGFSAMIFDGHFEQHTIIEGSGVVIDLFKQKHNNFKGIIVKDYFETYEATQKFDTIVMGFVLEHVDDPGLLLDRYRHMLADDGRIFICVPNAKSLNRRLGLELGIIKDIYELNDNDIALGHKRQFCTTTLKDLIESHNYEATHLEGIYLKPLPLGILKTLPDFKANLDAMLKVGIDFPELCVGILMEVKPL
jgi:SAM-dependent methyltransferase